MRSDKAEILFNKYINGNADDRERAIVESWYLHEGAKSTSVSADMDYQTLQNKIWNKIIAQRDLPKQRKINWLPYAAAILVIFCIGIAYYLRSKPAEKIYAANIVPGKVGATLTLANGEKIKLVSAAKGELANQAGISIVKTAEGKIVYQINETQGNLDLVNTLATARGETYMVILPDKSKVWMNAASSLTYTTNLLKNGIRSVKLNGEAYFEVAKDKLHPFVVETKNQQVKVLGTHFNINAYDDEHVVKTTLLEGSVEINKSVILKPNQQAILLNHEIKVIPVIADSFIDWQQGVFIFENDDMHAIMRKIARWYDVQIAYHIAEDNKQTFSGYMSRSSDIQKVLQNLSEISNLKFKIKDRTITVSQ